MKIKLEYESDVLLPKEIVESIKLMGERIKRDNLEYDKILCHIFRMQYDLVRWIDENWVNRVDETGEEKAYKSGIALSDSNVLKDAVKRFKNCQHDYFEKSMGNDLTEITCKKCGYSELEITAKPIYTRKILPNNSQEYPIDKAMESTKAFLKSDLFKAISKEK